MRVTDPPLPENPAALGWGAWPLGPRWGFKTVHDRKKQWKLPHPLIPENRAALQKISGGLESQVGNPSPDTKRQLRSLTGGQVGREDDLWAHGSLANG